jgi:GNAT superfamily N-acetyltransferase
MTPRHTTSEDRDFFLRLWNAHLHEMHAKGSEILPTTRTLDFYGDVFDAYLSGAREGVVAILYPAGVSLAGDATPSWDSLHGKTAIGWGTYVVPELRDRGHADALRRFVIGELAAIGFETLLGSVGVGDEAAEASIAKVPGVEVYQQVYRRRLG